MKYGLLIYPHNSDKIFNIGDYIQSIAARQFLPTIDKYLNRENLNKPLDDNLKLILNGWFMHSPNNWPPTENITPLFIAFHINKLAENAMLTREGIEYLKKNQPIGCRDYYTVELLKSKGIDAYFSGCLTLTLGQTYHHTDISDAPIYITDLNSTLKQDLKFKIECLMIFILKRRFINKIKQRLCDCGIQKRLRSIIAFYVTYKSVISDEVFVEAIYREQEIADTFTSEDEKFRYAESLLKQYSKARYVVTSRIHCALPCLAMQTPVVFVTNELLSSVHNCRLNGLEQLFYTIRINKQGIKINIPGITKLRLSSTFKNKTDYLSLAEKITKICRTFINN